jgi:hypothetical protein
MMMTDLDLAAAAMADGGDNAALRFYQLLADATLFVLLEHEPEGERITPKVFDLPDGPVLLAFDSEDRLAAWAQAPLPYAALPGRIIARHLTGTGVSMGLNFASGARSETLLPPEAMRWLAETLENAPTQIEARPAQFFAPQSLPEILADALRFTLSGAGGLAASAHLAGVRYADGRLGHMLAIVDALPDAEAPLAHAIAEAVSFSGLDAGELDVTFLASDAVGLAELIAVAQAFDLPAPQQPKAAEPPPAPGSNPDRPPRLR